MLPNAFCRAVLHRIKVGQAPPTRLPACLRQDAAIPPWKLPRLRFYYDRIIELMPDLLGMPKWQARCAIEGIEQIREALAQKRRVLLAFPHFSLYWEIRNWLRGAGLPVAFYAGADSQNRTEARRHKDRWALLSEVPTVFNSDQLADAIKFVASGRPLIIAMDGQRGRQLDVPVGDGWIFEFATGPLRIAARQDALLFPCAMIVEDLWRYRIKIGRPLPRELLGPEKEMEAASYLLKQLLPHFERYPEQCRPQLLGRFKLKTNSAVADASAP